MGSGFDPTRGSDQVILSERAWSKYFDRRQNVLGDTLVLDGVSYEVVGIAPNLPYPNDELELYSLWRMSATEEGQVAQHSAHVIGRLAAGASLDAAMEELQR